MIIPKQEPSNDLSVKSEVGINNVFQRSLQLWDFIGTPELRPTLET